MPTSQKLDRTFHFIMGRMIATGKAPDHTAIAAELGVSPAEGQKVLRSLISTLGFPGWFQPKTDTIMSFAPFSNVPNNYRLTIDGEQKWFAQ